MFNFLERLDQKWGLKGVWRQGRRLGDILNWIAIVFILVIRNCYCYLWQFTHTLWPLFELDFITHLCCKTYIPLLKANWHLIWKIITDTSINFKYSALQKKNRKRRGLIDSYNRSYKVSCNRSYKVSWYERNLL